MILLSLAPAVPTAWPRSAAGQEADAPASDDDRLVRASADPGRFLPGTLAPSAGRAAGAGLGWAGYDGAIHAPLLGMSAEARLGTRLVVAVGATYVGAGDAQAAALRPSVGLRAQFLDQARHRIDGGVALVYHQDRFFQEEGFMQASVLLGRRFSQGMVIANLSYGQDGEGDDHEGEVRLAGLGRIGAALHLGVDGHLRRSLASTDPHRAELGTPSMEYAVGPAATYTAGPFAIVLETGLRGVRTARLASGAYTLGGVGAVF